MAYAADGLRRLAHGGNVSTAGTRPVAVWSFATNDDAATVEAANYFLAAFKDLAVGDVIFAALDLDGTIQLKQYIVTVSNSTTLTIVGEQGGGLGAAVAARTAIQRFQFTMNLADIAAGDLMTAYTPGFNGKILALNVFAPKPATTAAKLASLNPKINATNVTGGVAALTSANMTPAGAKVAGSAVTALNTFTNTDTIGIVASAVTAFVEGVGLIVLDIENTDLKTALT